jgi:hypothetical protein
MVVNKSLPIEKLRKHVVPFALHLSYQHDYTHTHKVPGSSRVPVRAGQTHPHRPRLVVSHSTCPPLSSSPHAHSFVIGPAVIKHTHTAAELREQLELREKLVGVLRAEMTAAHQALQMELELRAEFKALHQALAAAEARAEARTG